MVWPCGLVALGPDHSHPPGDMMVPLLSMQKWRTASVVERCLVGALLVVVSVSPSPTLPPLFSVGGLPVYRCAARP